MGSQNISVDIQRSCKDGEHGDILKVSVPKCMSSTQEKGPGWKTWMEMIVRVRQRRNKSKKDLLYRHVLIGAMLNSQSK